ncbi:MAG: hypothetical protein MJ185_02610 [Treponema sp.]|nr:hypothetical protein [Treponema sp.]
MKKLICLGLFIFMITGFHAQSIKDFEPYEFPENLSYSEKKYRSNISKVLRKTSLYISDINNDRKINCLDYALTFYNLWIKEGLSEVNIELVHNVNPNGKMNHVFIRIRENAHFYNWECIEPSAPENGPYFMEDYWNTYNPVYNRYLTDFYSNKASAIKALASENFKTGESNLQKYEDEHKEEIDERDFQSQIKTILRKTQNTVRDVTGDGEINCIDYSLIFYKLWETSEYQKGAITCELVRNSGLNHLFVRVRKNNSAPWLYIEPQAGTDCDYLMKNFWKDYNPKYNYYGETEKWLLRYKAN